MILRTCESGQNEPERALTGGRQAAPVIKCGKLRSPRMLWPPRPASWCHDAIPSRLLSGSGGEAGKGNGDKKGGMVDVQGGKVEDTSRAEGHLVWAERAKNIVAAHRRFQLTTYNRLPNDLNDEDSIHTDTSKTAVHGLLHKEQCNLAILLRSDVPGHQKHKDNVSKLASASVAIGHLDPVKLVPVFTRVGLMPPVVRVVGDLVPIASPEQQEEIRTRMGVGSGDGSLYWLEVGGIFFEDIFSGRAGRNQVSVRDFRSAFVDPLAGQQLEAIHIANTQFFDYLPKFCRDLLGVPVEEAYLYSVDRSGFSIFALRDGTDDQWVPHFSYKH